MSHGSVIADIVPDSFRYLLHFLPLLRMERKGITLRFGKPFFAEKRLHQNGSRKYASPFEKMRVLDPAPDPGDLARARVSLERAFPIFSGVPTTASWGGLRMCTPDLLPIISRSRYSGFLYLDGVAGYGFGIGLGAGRLTADLVSGNRPIVDPQPSQVFPLY